MMTVTLISDTHGMHHDLHLAPGDLLIHAGDITEYGTEEEVTDFLDWFAKQPFTYKIFIAGNHDLFLETITASKQKRMMPDDITYLQNTGIIINGIKIYGSPVTPYFLGMAFNKRQGSELKTCFNKIPVDTDILITHGPPFGMMDNEMGSVELTERVKLIQPRLHVFGHIHEQHGKLLQNDTCFVNAAMLNTPDPFKNEPYKIISKPVIMKMERNENKLTIS